MLAIIAKLGLLLGNPLTYAVLIIVGFIFYNDRIFSRALFILLFTMIYNVWLKSIWQMPLPPPLEGWAFPSGHMHSAVAFWGWLAIEMRHKAWTLLTALILCLVGYGLVYHGYHYPIDIMGALGFGGLSLTLYYLISQQRFFQTNAYRLGILLALLAAGIILLMPLFARRPHVWQAWGILIGFSLGGLLSMRNKTTSPITIKQKIGTAA